MSSDILNKIVAVKHEEVAAAKKRLPFDAMRADAESLSLIHISEPTRPY